MTLEIRPRQLRMLPVVLLLSLAWGLGIRAPRLHKRLDGLAAHQEKAGQLLVTAWTLVQEGATTREA